MNKIGSGCILQDVHLGKGDKGLSLFFPIQNDSMSVLLIWRVQCQKKAQPTYSILFLENTTFNRKHTNMQSYVQVISFNTYNKLICLYCSMQVNVVPFLLAYILV